MVSYKVAKQLFLLFFSVLLFSTSKAQTDEQQTKINLRSIGHEFLLQLNDSTSRVLPIKITNNRYAVQFERTLSFEPDVLSSIVLKVMQENKLSERYIVEVEKCESNEVIHSFEANSTKDEKLVACKMRQLPEDCYVFYFTVHTPTKEIIPTATASKEKLNSIYLLLPLLFGGGIVIYLIKRKKKQKLKAELITIGLFQFDQKRMTLSLKAQSIELSTKESDLLLLLFSNENKTLERAYILNHIWGDEGDYVGRTLDVFISKLRKKLEADPSLKIINVRGVGYRFVVNYN
tara:strand:- start:485 stop:1354 length:870 start_codon:yes stop_codon:yes gene_type:complete